MKVGRKLPSDLKEAIIISDIASFASFQFSHRKIFGKKGKSLLHYISKYSDDFTLGTFCINTLKIKPNIHTRKGKFSPLHIASMYGKQNIVRSLLTYSEIDKDEQNAFGETSLSLACKYNKTGVVLLLLQNSVSLVTFNKKLWTPLHWASWNGNYLMVTALLEKGLNPEKLTKSDENCLHLAAENGNLDTVKLLCKYVSALKISQKGTLLHHGKEHPEILDYVLTDTPWKEFPKLHILLEIGAPLYILIKHCSNELGIQNIDLIMLYDRDDVILESYFRRIIGEADIKAMMQLPLNGKCENVVKKLNRWQTVKKILFVHMFSSKTNNFVNIPSNLLRETFLYI